MSKSYKLIKKYPGLHVAINEGDVVTKDDSGIWRFKNNFSSVWDDSYFKEYPEFWEEVIDTNALLKEAKERYPIGTDIIGAYTGIYKTTVNTLNFRIRTSYNSSGVDISFESKNGGTVYLKHNDKWAKIVKKPLFTTENCVDIFEGDVYWFTTRLVDVNSTANQNVAYGKGFSSKYIRFSTKELAQEYIDSKRVKVEDGYLYEGEDSFSVLSKAQWQCSRNIFTHIKLNQFSKDWKHFTTKEARDEYIELNKPMYSKKDMLDFATDCIYGANGAAGLIVRFNNWLKKCK